MSPVEEDAPAPLSSVDERQPLLSIAERDPEEQLEDDESDDAPLEKKPTTWWTWGWYAVGTVLIAVALGFFIKGFIDADDVEVRSQWK